MSKKIKSYELTKQEVDMISDTINQVNIYQNLLNHLQNSYGYILTTKILPRLKLKGTDLKKINVDIKNGKLTIQNEQVQK